MESSRISHIALHVESLSQAARFYARLFDLNAVSRDEGIASEERLLGRGSFRLLLRSGGAYAAAEGRLAHIGLRMRTDDLEALSCRAARLGCRVVQREPDQTLLEDVYGIRWLVTTKAAADDGDAPDP